MEENLGIGTRLENVPAADQVRAEFAVVIDLAVESNLQRAVLIRHGLLAGLGQVYDGQAPVAEHGVRVLVNTRAIRAAMNLGGQHAFHGVQIGDARRALASPLPDNSGNAAHQAVFFPLDRDGFSGP
jgi:hypothetical protein